MAYTHIQGLVSAALVPRALSYDIPISIVLKGARGVGKTTIVKDVARQLGVHAYEVRILLCAVNYPYRPASSTAMIS
jgi:peroxin-6